MELMIESRPDKAPDDLGYLVSVQFAQGLVDRMHELTGAAFFLRQMKSGDEFTYRGIKCKVA
jgi:hypothetical protein